MARISKETQQAMQELAKLFNSNVAELQKHACSGKYRGTTDYLIQLSDNRELFICNGAKYLKETIQDMVNLYTSFNTNKEVILNKIKGLCEHDRKVAEILGMHEYEIVDVDYCKSGTYIKWFYVLIKVNGKLIKHIETNLCSYIRQLCNDLTLPITHVQRKEYFIAGGLEKADYVFAGVGFDSNEGLYKIIDRDLCS